MISDILINLIKFKTIYPNYNEIENCFNYVKEYYNDTNLLIKEFCFNKDKSLFISNTEDKNLDVLFVGHIDVVYGVDTDFIPEIVDGKLYGRGSFDMKGHDAVMMKLLKDIKSKLKIGLLLTSDEERGGFNGTYKFLNQLHYNAKIAIVPDAGNNFHIIDEEKGVLQLKISYKGKESHSSQVWKGDNAISKILDLYKYLIDQYPLPTSSEDYKTSINISKILGGDSTNMVAGNCYAILDIRHTASDSKENLINLIKKYNSNIEVEILAKGEPFLTIKNDIYKEFEKSYKRVLKKDVVYYKFESASDGRFFYSKGIPCVLMNAIGNNIHSENEYVEIDSLETLYKIYLDFIENIERNN